MALYRSSFERYIFGVSPPLKQTADVLLNTEIPFDDEHIGEFDSALWKAMWEQNPHWKDSSAPAGLPSGWSSVLSSHKVERVSEAATLSVVWHYPQEGWLKADRATMTVDVDEAGRFTSDQVMELQAMYPGERHSMVTPHLVSELYAEDGAPYLNCELQVRYDEYVLWGEGPRTENSYVEASIAKRGGEIFQPDFKLPEKTQYRPDPREYERRSSWAWRFIFNGMPFGEGWNLAETKEAAIEAALADGVKEMRSTGHHHCEQVQACKHAVKVVDTRIVAPSAVLDASPVCPATEASTPVAARKLRP